MIWSGLYTALITPFDKEENLDEAGLRQIIHSQMQEGADGLVVLGTTGEEPTLSLEEKTRIVTIARKEAAHLPLVVGCGSNSTQDTIERVKWAASLGADGVLLVSPYYNKPTQEGLFLHYERIAKHSPLPIIVYDHPGRTATPIHMETLKRIAEIPQVVGFKLCSGQIEQIQAVIGEIKMNKPAFAVFSGDDSLAFSLLALGGDGVISVVSNLLTKMMKELIVAFRSQNIQLAQLLHYKMLPLFKALLLETNPIPIKAAMQLCGLPAGNPRLPLTPFQKTHLSLLQQTLCDLS